MRDHVATLNDLKDRLRARTKAFKGDLTEYLPKTAVVSAADRNGLIGLVNRKGYEVDFVQNNPYSNEAAATTVHRDRRVVVTKRGSDAEFYLLAHEAGHVLDLNLVHEDAATARLLMLFGANEEEMQATVRGRSEVRAELTAYLVSKAKGITTVDDTTVPYLWNSGLRGEGLEEEFDEFAPAAIRSANEILEALQ
jgi:hypothetical protein